jgi:hypothetical protein
MKFKTTGRGFGYLEFADDYAQVCTLQHSSNAERECIWLGLSNTGPHMDNKDVNNRMHLNRVQARQIAKKLLRFADTGEVK